MEVRTSWLDGRNLERIGHVLTHNDSFHPDPRDVIKAGLVIDRAVRIGGVTIDRGYVAMYPRFGFIVGGKNPGRSYPLDAGRDELAYQLHRYIVSSPSYIVPTYIGVWVHDDRVWFDTVEIVPILLIALMRGREQNQESVHDIAHAEDIPVTDTAIAQEQHDGALLLIRDAIVDGRNRHAIDALMRDALNISAQMDGE